MDKSLRKQALIDTAAELFHKKGYSATSLEDVSRALGISKPAIYHYVKNKNELLTIIYTQAFENIFKDTLEISNMDLPPDEKLRRIIRHHITNIIVKDMFMFSVFFSEESKLPPKDFNKIKEEKRRYTKIFETIIKEGINQGLFKNTDPKLQAYAILGMCNWIYKWYEAGKTPFTPDRIGNHFIDLLELGYKIPDPEKIEPAAELSSRDAKKNRNRPRTQIIEQIQYHTRKLNHLALELSRPRSPED